MVKTLPSGCLPISPKVLTCSVKILFNPVKSFKTLFTASSVFSFG